LISAPARSRSSWRKSPHPTRQICSSGPKQMGVEPHRAPPPETRLAEVPGPFSIVQPGKYRRDPLPALPPPPKKKKGSRLGVVHVRQATEACRAAAAARAGTLAADLESRTPATMFPRSARPGHAGIRDLYAGPLTRNESPRLDAPATRPRNEGQSCGLIGRLRRPAGAHEKGRFSCRCPQKVFLKSPAHEINPPLFAACTIQIVQRA